MSSKTNPASHGLEKLKALNFHMYWNFQNRCVQYDCLCGYNLYNQILSEENAFLYNMD